jgi:transcriptional regulator with XRE-family HTH domain
MHSGLSELSLFTIGRMTFAQKVVKLREAKGWKQSDLRRAIGDVSPTTVSNWESGAIPSMDVALKVARALGVSLDYLADDAQEHPPASGTTVPERQLASMIERYGAERVYWRLVEVGMGRDSAGLMPETGPDHE